MKPTVISTFAGCGGSSLGYHMAGFKELLATDWEENACETLKLNFPDTLVLQEDITKLTPERVLELTNIKPRELTVLDGSPPCQGFSTAGDRNVGDSRNDLYMAFVKLIKGLQPKVFVMENVPGMILGKMKGAYNLIMQDLKSLDYNVSTAILNAADYGVPQARKRLIFIGYRKDLNKIPSFPVPTSRHISVLEALQGLEITEKFNYPGGVVSTKVLDRAREGQNGSRYNKNSFFNWARVSRFKPSPTITKTAGLFHWSENRFLTIQELKRLASFPDDFQFIGRHRTQWARIGNAVMPKMMEAIGNHIRKELNV